METRIPDSTDTERRAALVKGIRALADLIEARTDLPVPQSCGAQYSMWDTHGDFERRCAEIRRVADALEGRGEISDHGRTVRFEVSGYPARVAYVANAAPDRRPTPAEVAEAVEPPAGVPSDAAQEFARSRAEGRDSVESAVRALIPGARL
jgi:hypothetical protein